MSVQLINGHVLFPHQADFKTPPDWQRVWQNTVTPASAGNESRRSMREQPLIQLTWLVMPWSNVEQNQFEERLKKAKKCGKACAPYWGRGSVLNADCNDVLITLKNTPWPWAVDDQVFLSQEIGGRDASNGLNPPAYETARVQAVTPVGDEIILTLTAPVSRNYEAGQLCYPLLYGKISTNDLSAFNADRGAISLTLKEQTSSASKQIGTVQPVAGAGIGWMTIGTTFTIG